MTERCRAGLEELSYSAQDKMDNQRKHQTPMEAESQIYNDDEKTGSTPKPSPANLQLLPENVSITRTTVARILQNGNCPTTGIVKFYKPSRCTSAVERTLQAGRPGHSRP